MSLTAGALSKVSVGQTAVSLLSGAATGGTGPYTYQWYRSTVSGFTPGVGNAIASATALALSDSGLVGGTQYYYKVISTDTGNGNATVTSSQLSVITNQAGQQPNQFAQTSLLGMIDLGMGIGGVLSAQVDASSAGLVSGQAVKMVDSANGIPKVVECAANSDEVLGFVIFNTKNQSYKVGDAVEIAMAQSCIYLQPTAAIARGTQVVLDLLSVGGIQQSTGSGGENKVGWAVDKAVDASKLIRVMLTTPSFSFDS